MEKEGREAMRVLLFEGQQVTNQSPALVLGALVVLRLGQGGPGGLQHMRGLQPAAPIRSFGAGIRSHREKMQPFNPSLSKDERLWEEKEESYERVQATLSLNGRLMLPSQLHLL